MKPRIFRMEYAQILIYIVFLGLLKCCFYFEANYFLMIYLLIPDWFWRSLFMPAVYENIGIIKSEANWIYQNKMHDSYEILRIARFCRRRVSIWNIADVTSPWMMRYWKYKIEAAGYREIYWDVDSWSKNTIGSNRLILENHPNEITRAMDEEMADQLLFGAGIVILCEE